MSAFWERLTWRVHVTDNVLVFKQTSLRIGQTHGAIPELSLHSYINFPPLYCNLTLRFWNDLYFSLHFFIELLLISPEVYPGWKCRWTEWNYGTTYVRTSAPARRTPCLAQVSPRFTELSQSAVSCSITSFLTLQCHHSSMLFIIFRIIILLLLHQIARLVGSCLFSRTVPLRNSVFRHLHYLCWNIYSISW